MAQEASGASSDEMLPAADASDYFLPSLLELEMRQIYSQIKNFYADERGVTAIEYGLIAALVALALMVGATTLGTKLSASFEYIAGLMKVA